MNHHGVTLEEAFESIAYSFNNPSTTITEDLVVVGVFSLIIIGLIIANKKG